MGTNPLRFPISARGFPVGRGRAKAKQAKVARSLKYNSPNTDFDQLKRELAGSGGDQSDEEQWYEAEPERRY